jgi:hypothetical protein
MARTLGLALATVSTNLGNLEKEETFFNLHLGKRIIDFDEAKVGNETSGFEDVSAKGFCPLLGSAFLAGDCTDANSRLATGDERHCC